MVEMRYVDKSDFHAFCENQDRLIEVLNHSMTNVKNDVGWLKKLAFWEAGLLASIFLTLLSIVLNG